MKASRLIAIALLSSTILINDNNRAEATHTEQNGCSTPWSGYLQNNPAGADFGPACNGHDLCYGNTSKSKGACDLEFHNGMRAACERKFLDPRRNLWGVVTTLGTGGAAIANCYTWANNYFQGVLQAPQAADSYREAQEHARGGAMNTPITSSRELTTTARPLTVSEQCYNVASKQGWQYFNFPNTFSRVTSIHGAWSVDYGSYALVGPEGHSGEAARKLEPYNQYKYDQSSPFGALLIDIPNVGYSWVNGSQALNRPIQSTAMRINDGDNALGDNAGGLRVCFGK